MYAAQVQVAYARAWRSPWPYPVALIWMLFPFAVATVLHPSAVIWAQAVMQGLDKPHWFTSQQLASGEVQALFALAVLTLVQIVGTTLFYRLVKMARPGERPAIPTLWVLAGLAGVVGDAVWVAFGQVDLSGMLVGCSPVVLTIFAEWVVNGLPRFRLWPSDRRTSPNIPILVKEREMTRFFDKVRQARATLTAPETVATLDYILDYYGNGENWTKGVYSAVNGARCLVGAADHVRVSAVDDAKYHLRQAIAEREPHWTIEQFNDNCEDFSEIVAVIRRAKELALAAQSVRPATRAAVPSAPVVEVLPPNAPAWLPAPRPAPTASVPQVPLARTAPVMIDVTPRPEPQRVRAPAPASANRRRASLFWELLGE